MTFEKLMEVINGKVTVKGQSGKESVGAAQMKYFGTRFGATLDIETLVKKCEDILEDYRWWLVNLQCVIDGNRDERDAAVAQKIGKKVDALKHLSPENLDAMIAGLIQLKETKTQN